jgi:hypothetical protein
MPYDFIPGMVKTCGWEWDHAFLLGYIGGELKMYLRGDITREDLTADYAQYELARDRFYRLLDQEDDTVLAMQKLVTELGFTVGAGTRGTELWKAPSEVSLPPAGPSSEGPPRT